MMQPARSPGIQLLFFLAVLYCTFIGGTFYTDFLLPLRVLHHLLVGAALLGWLVYRLRRGEGLPRTPLDVPLIAWLAALFLTALLGIHPRFSLEKLWTPFTWVLIFYLLFDLAQRGYTSLVLRALYMSATVVCLVSLTELVSWYLGMPLLPQFVQSWPSIGSGQLIPPTLHRLSLAMNGATPLSAYIALLIPPAIAILATTPLRDSRRAMSLWLVLACVVEALSMSRGGILALLVSLPLTALAFHRARRGIDVAAITPGGGTSPHVPEKSDVKRKWLLPGAGLTVGIVVLVAMLGSPWWQRTFAERTGSTNFRFTLWQIALRTFQNNPWTGVGPFNYGRSLLRQNDASLPRRQMMTAHNLYLNTAAESGWVGLAAGGWLLVSAMFAFRRRWQEVYEVHQRMRIGAAGAALAGFAAQNLVDTFTATPVVLPALVLMASALAPAVPGHGQQPPSRLHGFLTPPKRLNWRRPLSLIALGTLALYTLSLLWWDGAQYHLQRSIRLAQEGRWEEAVAAATRARQMDPGMALYTFQLAHVLSEAGARMDTLEAHPLTVQASNLYRVALAAEPVHGRQSANLAATLWRLGDREGALVAMQAAVAADPAPVLAINLGYFYQQVGDIPRAMAAYARALASAPELGASQFWEADATRRMHWPEIVRRAEQALPAHHSLPQWQLSLALARQEWDAVKEHAAALANDPSVRCLALSAMARAQLADDRLQEALQAAEQAIRADAACGGAYLVRGQVRLRQGEERAAERNWRTALFLGLSRAAYHLGQLDAARGDWEAAVRWYRYALPVTALPTDVEVVLYDRHVAFELLPPLFHIGIGPEEAAPYFALADLYQAQGDAAVARQLYQMLLVQDPYLFEAQRRLEALKETP